MKNNKAKGKLFPLQNKEKSEVKKTMIISIKENNITVGIITEMILNKKAQLYKTTRDFEIYQIKNSDIKIALVSINSTNFKNKEKAIEFNTQVITNLYQLTSGLNKENLIKLCNLNVFM